MLPKIAIPPEFEPGACLEPSVAARYLKACGAAVKLYRGCRIVGGANVSMGDGSQIDEGVNIFAGLGVSIGRYVHLAFASSISGGGSCEIGDFAGIGAGVRIITGTDLADGSGLTNPTVPENLRAVTRGRVSIGAHALIYTNAILLPNVTIGEGAVVGAASVVHHDLQPWTIYAGNPLVAISARSKDEILRRAAQIR